jgi:hypothetical protein
MSSLILTGDTSGTITLAAPAVAGTHTLTMPVATGTAVLEDASGVLQMNSGYGSNAAAYGCRAWVNFNGTGTVAIRDSANVSSITDRGTGTYTVNFTTAMVDANYAVGGVAGGGDSSLFNLGTSFTTIPQSVSACPVATTYANGSNYDVIMISVIIFR